MSYQVRIRGADGRYITKVVQSRTEAETYETTLLNQRNHSVLPTQLGNRITMDEYFVLWFEAVKFQASLGWRKQQEKMYANHIKPVIGQIKLGKVSASLIALILNRMANRGLSPAARLHIYGLLRKLFSDARDLSTFEEPIQSMNINFAITPKTENITSFVSHRSFSPCLSKQNQKPTENW